MIADESEPRMRKDKTFFFEKKEPKNFFAALRAVLERKKSKLIKFFCFFLFTKRSSFLLS